MAKQQSEPTAKPTLDAEYAAYWAILEKTNVEKDELPEPFSFWESHYFELEQLAELAFEVLSIPATSSEVERSFSQAGHIVGGRRWSLSDANLERETFLRHNKALLNL